LSAEKEEALERKRNLVCTTCVVIDYLAKIEPVTVFFSFLPLLRSCLEVEPSLLGRG
jgi:hypothetical protein